MSEEGEIKLKNKETTQDENETGENEEKTRNYNNQRKKVKQICYTKTWELLENQIKTIEDNSEKKLRNFYTDVKYIRK